MARLVPPTKLLARWRQRVGSLWSEKQTKLRSRSHRTERRPYPKEDLLDFSGRDDEYLDRELAQKALAFALVSSVVGFAFSAFLFLGQKLGPASEILDRRAAEGLVVKGALRSGVASATLRNGASRLSSPSSPQARSALRSPNIGFQETGGLFWLSGDLGRTPSGRGCLNTPKFAKPEHDEQFKALQSAEVLFNAQPIALVVAETFEQARAASNLVKATYRKEKPNTDGLKALPQAVKAPDSAFAGPSVQTQGDVQAGLSQGPVQIDAVYTIPIEHHNPMEPHAAVAYWQDGKLKIFDKTQNVYNVREHLAAGLGIPAADVHVVSPYVGGAFGCSLEPNYYPYLTAIAAKVLQRPVKLVYSRRQMFTGHGYRPFTHQKIRLAAKKNGELTSCLRRSKSEPLAGVIVIHPWRFWWVGF